MVFLTKFFLLFTLLLKLDDLLATDEFDTYTLKLKVPFGVLKTYQKIISKNRQNIFELLEPNLSIDEYAIKKERFLYAEWMLSSEHLTNDLLKTLKLNKIIYKSIKHKVNKSWKKDKHEFFSAKRLKRSTQFETVIDENNLVENYYSVSQIFEWIETVARNNSFIEISDIGYTVMDVPLKVLKIGYRSDKPKKLFWFDAGIHAREWNTIATAMYTINEIIREQAKAGSMMNRFLKKYDIYFLVMVNPDGYDLSLNVDLFWRKNLRGIDEAFDDCFGVDLNRNFDYHWMKTGSSNDNCSYIYAGEKVSSEPETKAVQDFILGKKGQWLSFITIHSYGGYWLHHWENNNAKLKKEHYIELCTKSNVALKAMNKIYKHKYLFGIPSALLEYDASGSSDSWAMMVADIKFSFTIEIGPTQSQIEATEKLEQGFIIESRKIKYVAQRAYKGFREYLQTFIIKPRKNKIESIEEKCSLMYNNLMREFTGYWS